MPGTVFGTIRMGLAGALALALLAGCAGQRLLPAPPEDVYESVLVPGYPPDVRIWGDVTPPDLDARLSLIQRQIVARATDEGKLPNGGRFDVLVLSGGGSDGAFGAGVLNAWSEAGTRPEFGLVTGISTGALIAPYAFLGSAQDPALKAAYTEIGTDDVLQLEIFQALSGRLLGISDSSKLRDVVARVLTPEFIEAIAREHGKGRRLLVGTTGLDSQRPMTWDVGAIAASRNPGARDLIRDVLVASASIPVAFPPVEFQVIFGNKAYGELHADGGVTRQLFLYPADIELPSLGDGEEMRLGSIWIIRNSKLDPEYGEVEPTLSAIGRRSVSTLLKAAGIADVEVIRAQAERDGWGLQLTSVPADFTLTDDGPFDPEYMQALYDRGFAYMASGEAWKTAVEPQP